MSIANTIAELAEALKPIDPTPQPKPARIYTNPAEALTLADFPAIVLALAPNVENEWGSEATGPNTLGQHQYIIAVYVFVGSRETTKLPELHSRVLPWVEPVAKALFASLTLGGSVYSIGPLRYQIGPIEWADSTYFGIRFLLQITEYVEV
jgi:hypothetical protein